jgi:hypothetical protein
MATTVKDLIERLSKYHPDMQVVLETDDLAQLAYDAVHNSLPSILVSPTEAQSSRDEGDSFAEMYIEYDFDFYEDPVDKKTVLMLSYI